MNNSGKVCAKCQIELRPLKNGVAAVEMASFGPAAIYDADLWHCPSCGAEIILGFGAKPYAEHFCPDFGDILVRLVVNRVRLIRFWATGTEKTTSVPVEELS